MAKKVIFFIFVLKINNILAQHDDQRWNIATGVMPFRQEILNPSFDNIFLDFICNIKVEHKLTKRANIGLSYYLHLLTQVKAARNGFQITFFPTFSWGE
jgi:hypothetical protein